MGKSVIKWTCIIIYSSKFPCTVMLYSRMSKIYYKPNVSLCWPFEYKVRDQKLLLCFIISAQIVTLGRHFIWKQDFALYRILASLNCCGIDHSPPFYYDFLPWKFLFSYFQNLGLEVIVTSLYFCLNIASSETLRRLTAVPVPRCEHRREASPGAQQGWACSGDAALRVGRTRWGRSQTRWPCLSPQAQGCWLQAMPARIAIVNLFLLLPEVVVGDPSPTLSTSTGG